MRFRKAEKGFPSTHKKTAGASRRGFRDMSAQIIFRELKQFKARLKTTLFKKCTQFAAYLRSQRVNAARMIRCAPKKRAAKGRALKSRKNDLSAQIIFRELKQFKARLKTALFKKCTQFAAYLRSQRVNAARMIRCAPKKRAAKGRALKSRKNDLSAQIIFREQIFREQNL